MTEFSWPWGCDQVGDGGSASYSLDVVEVTNRVRTNLDPTSNGVVYWTDTAVLPFTNFTTASTGLLEPTNPSGNTVRIASGIGLVQGWLYANDSNVDFDASGAASATDIIVMRRTRADQTVRLVLVQAAASGTATVTQTAAVWDVLLCTIELTAAGAVNRITDNRSLVTPPVGSMTLIESVNGTGASDTISFAAIPPLFPSFRIIGYARTDAGGVGSNIEVSFNADVGANYDSSITTSVNSAITHTPTVGANAINIGFCTGAGGAAGNDMFIVDIAGVLATTPKTLTAVSNAKRDGTTGATGLTSIRSDGWYSGTANITQIDLIATPSANFIATSIFKLYGIV